MSGLSKKQGALLIAAMQGMTKGKGAEEAKRTGSNKETVIATLAANPQFGAIDAESIGNMISFDIGMSRETTVVDAENKVLGKDKYTPIADSEIGYDVESFDTLNAQNNISLKLASLNVAANNLLTKDDGIIDLFTVSEVAAGETGKKIIASNPLITINTVNSNGVAIGGSKMSLISNLGSKEVFSAGRLPLKPVLRSSGDYPTAEFLQTLITRPTVVNGEKVNTSPILIGKKVNLRTLCINAGALNEHSALVNPNMTLSEEGHLSEVYLKIKDTNDLVNILQLNVKGEKGTRFASTNQGNGKDVVITYQSTSKIKSNEILANKQLAYASTADTLIPAVAVAGLEIVLGFTVSVSANTDTMLVTTSSTAVEVISVSKAGALLPKTDAEFKAVADLFEAQNVVDSYYLDIYQSNTNNTDNGIIVDVEETNYEIPAVIKAPVTFRKSVLGEQKPEALAGYLVAANITASSMMTAELMDLIEESIAINGPKADADGFIRDVSLDGIGANYIKPMIVRRSINAADRITMKSSEVKDDISKILFDTMIAVATKTFTDSGFDKAVDSLATGETVTLQLVGDRETVSYIQNAIGKTPIESLPFTVKASVSTKLNNKVLATFKLPDIYEFSPLIMVKAPNFIYKGIELAGNSGNQDTCKMVPRRNALVNVPLFMEFEISGIVDAFKK